MTPFRLNWIIIATLIGGICGGIIFIILMALTIEASDASMSAFIIGALIGLLGSRITGLASLGSTLLNGTKSNQWDPKPESSMQRPAPAGLSKSAKIDTPKTPCRALKIA